jgi:ribonuclease BN (tRNA processing enzyme)
VEARIVGAHQAASADQHFTSILVDGKLAIDAGSLTSGLSLDEQLAIESVLLTHRHWDHLKDLPGLGFNLYSFAQAGRGSRSIDVWCSDDVRQTLADLLLSDRFWMNFFAVPDSTRPIFRHRPVVVGEPFPVGDYVVEAIPVNHAVPTAGYQVTDLAGRKLYYTSDNGPGCGEAWAGANPDLLVTECTFSNAQCGNDGGNMHGHLCPSQLQIELATFRARRGYLPRLAIVHVNPFYEAAIRAELAVVARELGASIDVAVEGDRIQV